MKSFCFFFWHDRKIIFVTLLRLSTSSVHWAWKGKNTVLKTLSLMIIIILDYYYFVMIIGMLSLSSLLNFQWKVFTERQKVYYDDDDDDDNKYECKHRKKWVIIKNWSTLSERLPSLKFYDRHYWASPFNERSSKFVFRIRNGLSYFQLIKKLNSVA